MSAPASTSGWLRTALVVLLGYAVLGAVAGVVWEWLWTPPTQVIQQHQVYYDSYASMRRVFSGTALYAIIGTVASTLFALLVTILTRGREVLVLVLVIVGSAVAAFVMLKVGTHLGPADPASIAAHTTHRTRVSGQLTVEGTSHAGIKSPYLVWPMASLFVLALVYFAWPHAASRHAHVETAPAHRSEAPPPSPRHG